ncbi:uncharacterized protein YpmB [Aquisalibacillus elongatus]|uniref:Uncharacterized protein YpmB n=1 Tax=Aquisalibacillus elongatus TaxID=485577 RepID=A0A3N5BDN0_9BACI|nr:uncharacterized protein YpmB [Aquisalibacillus elongatus]
MQLLGGTMRKVLLICLTILIAIAIIGLFTFLIIYNGIQNDMSEMEERSINQAKSNSPIETVEGVRQFNGQSSYIVVTGQNENEKLLHAFIPDSNDEELEVEWVEAEEGLTEEEMLTEWRNNCSQCDLMSITPGIMNSRYVWEIIYEENNRIYFQTYRFINGEIYDSISFNKD